MASWDDQFLFMLIACLEDLTAESNFAQHSHDLKWDSEDFWGGAATAQVQTRDFYCHQALRVRSFCLKVPCLWLTIL